MKKVLLFVTMAAVLLFTQCKKSEDSASSEGKTVNMTITVGPGGKTDITPMGGITWSNGDKIYVGDGTKYVGSLTLASGVGTATATFKGSVTLTGVEEGDNVSFGFYYLGSADRTLSFGAESVEVDFSQQNIYKNGNTLQNASLQHVGYGSASGTVINGTVTGINVTLVSKVAIAHFGFKKSDTDYTGELTLSGSGIYNKMVVNFNSRVFDYEGTKGEITLNNNGHDEYYVMLVPTGNVTPETLTFTGTLNSRKVSGNTTLDNGIMPNKFYGKENKIGVTLKAPMFSVGGGRTVEFAPGNLYWDGSAFHFETSQTAYTTAWDASHVDRFFWSKTASVAYAETYADETAYGDVFFTNKTETTAKPDFTVDGETGVWRTLSKDEWDSLLNNRGGNVFAKAKVNDVKGLLIFPDGYETTSGDGIASINVKNVGFPSSDIPSTTWSAMEYSGVVFLPIMGYYYNNALYQTGARSRYWSSTNSESNKNNAIIGVDFYSSSIDYVTVSVRNYGYTVRLVR